MIVLHPFTKVIYLTGWQGVRSEIDRLALAFTPRMLPMTGAFALLGAVIGLFFGYYHRIPGKHKRALGFLEAELGDALASLCRK